MVFCCASSPLQVASQKNDWGMAMSYADLIARMRAGGVVVIDGATGTELERRGAPMNDDAWCGLVSLTHRDALEA
ncbi:MAG: hypothetical protein CMH68_10820, partial [Nisaea sp.]|nr:hypothetical protein [Nisaea sp.]